MTHSIMSRAVVPYDVFRPFGNVDQAKEQLFGSKPRVDAYLHDRHDHL